MAQDLKDTLQLPKTDFPMRAALAQREPVRLEKLNEIQITELKVILKADFRGSIEAIRKEMEKLHHEEVRVRILHAAIGGHELAMMGRRASGGCVRLPIGKANKLYHRFLAEERGQVPVFTFDETRGTTNTAGAVTHDISGNIVLSDGLKVLVVIENYAGRVTQPTQS